MSDELFLNGKTYVSSKRAAQETGYARDYIGQLARGGQIDAERVGGLWYVSMDSLQGYEKNAESAKTLIPVPAVAKDGESALAFEGKEYISASRAAKETGYNQDYVGQLARGGKIPSRQIGNRWYVDKDALVAHKTEKDALLAAVQAQSVGIKHEIPEESVDTAPPVQQRKAPEHILVLPQIKYTHDERDLIPAIPEKNPSREFPMSNFTEIRPVESVQQKNIGSHEVPAPVEPKFVSTVLAQKAVKRSRRRVASTTVGVLTIILVLSVGILSMNDSSVFAGIRTSKGMQSMSAGAAEALGSIGDTIEDLVSPLIVYNRGQ